MERTVINEPRRDRKRSNVHGLAMTQISGHRKAPRSRHEEHGLLKDRGGCFAQVNRHARVDQVGQPVVVGVGMGDHQCLERAVPPRPQAVNVGQEVALGHALRVQRQPGVEDQSLASALELDQASTDLVRPTMNADLHESASVTMHGIGP